LNHTDKIQTGRKPVQTVHNPAQQKQAAQGMETQNGLRGL